MRFAVIVLLSAVPAFSFGDEHLASKVIRIPLNQNEPAVVKLGTRGITTLEFPDKIEALDGYGFSFNPVPDGPELFQISFNKGTNFLSLKAMRDGVEGNLTVVLDGKAYSLFCKAVPDPSFVVIFENGSAKEGSGPREVLAANKQPSPSRLLGFLDKVKAFPSLRVTAPGMFQNMSVTEPNSESSVDGLEVTLRRVIRDNGLDSLGFEIELVNKTDKDFVYDPESFGVRVGAEVYPQTISDGGGLVSAGKTETAFFVVAGTATGDRNDLAVTNKFEIVMRRVTGERNARRKAPAEWREPPDTMPTSQSGWQEPPLPSPESGSTSSRLSMVSEGKERKLRKHRGKPSSAPGANRSTQFTEKGHKEETVAQDDE